VHHVSVPGLSGDRFAVIYSVAAENEASARQRALDICLEQTVEFPPDLLPPGDIPDHILGRLEAVEPQGSNRYQVRISYAVEITGFELTQLVNVVFGNSSIKPGLRVERLALTAPLHRAFRGPRFGRTGLRELLGVPERPLLCTALKPMGLSAARLGEMAYQCALGGIDLIKDDHGLADQSFAPFRERVLRCVEGVARANHVTGEHCLYLPHLAGPLDTLQERAHFAREAGAGGLMVAPGLVGLDAVRLLANDNTLNLPLLSHPALLGSYVTSGDSGLSHFTLFGQLMRLAGADAVIFPNYGGRFSFSRGECQSISDSTRSPMGHIRPIFPAPGGGMSLDSVPDMLQLYGSDVIFLIGGGLHRHGPDLAAGARHFRELVSVTQHST